MKETQEIVHAVNYSGGRGGNYWKRWVGQAASAAAESGPWSTSGPDLLSFHSLEVPSKETFEYRTFSSPY